MYITEQHTITHNARTAADKLIKELKLTEALDTCMNILEPYTQISPTVLKTYEVLNEEYNRHQQSYEQVGSLLINSFNIINDGLNNK